MRETALNGRRILVVEDEYFLADELHHALKGAGATVLGPAPTIQAALDLIVRDNAPEAAVLDFNLRGEMAYPVADALAERGIPFLFTTGYDPAALPKVHAAAPCLEKPVETAVTLRELERLLAGTPS